MMNLQTAVKYMLENGYMVSVKGKYKVTSKFNKEVTGKEVGLMVVGGKELVVESTALVVTGHNPDWTQLYLQFIKEAEVPLRCDGRSGSSYEVNKYSDDGMKAFRKAIEKEKVLYQVLVKSTMLYYKTHRTFALTIHRYISEGGWRSDYDAMFQSAKEGHLDEHIQSNIKADQEFNWVKIG